MKLLVLRVTAIGDVVLVTPLLRALAARHPGAELHVVTSRLLAPLLAGLPHVTKVHAFDAKGAGALRTFAATLRAHGPFDLAIDLQNKLRTRALLLLVGAAEKRVFVKRRGAGALLRALAGADPVLDDRHQLALVAEAAGLERADGPLELSLPEASVAQAAALLPDGPGPLVAIAPGARWGTKRWPAAHFAALGDALSSAGARLVLAGGPGDAAELDETFAALQAKPVADTRRLDVAAMTAVLARCALVVTNDSAPVHLAQAVGTPVLALFGPTSARRWGPLPGGGVALHRALPCMPCSNHGTARCPLGHHACLQDLPVASVIGLAGAALAAGRGGGAAALEAALPAALAGLASGTPA